MIEINNLDSNVNNSIDSSQDLLAELAWDESLLDSIFTTAFGNNIDTEITRNFLQQLGQEWGQQWRRGDLPEFPLIEHNDRNVEVIPILLPEELEYYIGLDSSVPKNMVTLDSIIGRDDRVLVGDTDWDQRIAFITAEFPDGSRIGFTGALISPFHILTVAHGIYNRERGGFVSTESIQVSLGQDGTERYYGTANAANYNYFTGYTDNSNWLLVDGEWKHHSNNDDMAIITLDRNIGHYTGWFDYQYNSDHSYFQNLTVNSAGYPGDLARSWPANVDMYHVSGPIIQVHQNIFRYELDTAGGQSGSPVWTYNPSTEERYIVGVHSFGSTFSNGAVRITEDKFNSIQALIQEEEQFYQPLDRPDFVDYDEWFGTDFAYFQNNTTGHLLDDLSNSIISVEAGDFITFRSVVRNNGTARVDHNFYFAEPTIDVSFFASTNEIISDLDYKLGEVTISALDPFTWRDVYLDTIFPNIPEGYYYIGYTFDSVMTEFDTSNNQGLIDDSLIYVI